MEPHKCCAVAVCVVFCKLSDIYQSLLISCASVEQYDHFFQCLFISLLCTVWSNPTNASKLQGRNVIRICEGTAYQLTSEDGKTTEKKEIETLLSTQVETDSRVVLYCMYGKEKEYQYIRIKSPDSDVFFILLHYALTLKEVVILFDTCT